MSLIDIVVLTLFVFMLFMFVKGFNKQQIDKHKERMKQQNINKKEKNN